MTSDEGEKHRKGEKEMGKEEGCRERGQNHMLMIFQAKETFQIMTFFSRSSILRLAKEKFALCSLPES